MAFTMLSHKIAQQFIQQRRSGGAPRETMEGDSLPYHLFMHCSGERVPRRSDTAAQFMSSSTTRPSRCVPRPLPSLSPAALASCVPELRV